MKIGKMAVLGAALVLMAVSQSGADLYNDATGETIYGDILDIVSVEVVNDATDLTITINLAGDPIATDWGKYLVGIDSVGGGDTASNPWTRPISMSSGMDYFLGSWADSGNGAEVYNWNGAAWNLFDATYGAATDIQIPIKTTNSISLTTSLASLGLSVSDSFVFDVWTTGGGGGDSAVDALSDPNQSIADWGNPYDSTSALSYTVIPEPATIGLIGIFGAGLIIARRKFEL